MAGNHPEELDKSDTLQIVDVRTGISSLAVTLPPNFLTVGQVARDLWPEPRISSSSCR